MYRYFIIVIALVFLFGCNNNEKTTNSIDYNKEIRYFFKDLMLDIQGDKASIESFQVSINHVIKKTDTIVELLTKISPSEMNDYHFNILYPNAIEYLTKSKIDINEDFTDSKKAIEYCRYLESIELLCQYKNYYNRFILANNYMLGIIPNNETYKVGDTATVTAFVTSSLYKEDSILFIIEGDTLYGNNTQGLYVEVPYRIRQKGNNEFKASALINIGNKTSKFDINRSLIGK